MFIFIADGMFIVRLSNNLKSATFSSCARSILTKLLKCTKYRWNLRFDAYESPSIKNVKRKARGDNEVERYFNLISNKPYRPILNLFLKFQNISHNFYGL